MINKYKTWKSSSIFFFISYISILLFSLFLYTYNFNSILSYEIILKSLLTSIILWYILYITSFNKFFYIISIILLTLILTIKIYYTFILGAHIEPSIFEGMFETTIDEAQRLGSNKPIFIFLGVILYLFIVLEFNWLKTFSKKKKIIIHLSKIFLIFILLLAYGWYDKKLDLDKTYSLLLKTFPISFIDNLYIATKAQYTLYKMNNNKVDIVKKYNFTSTNDDNLTVVFIRGESLRARSFPVTGDHIPLNRKIDIFKNTVVFKNVFSYANRTGEAVPWMLVRSVDDKLQNEKSFISVVKFMGFNTTWISHDTSNLASFAQTYTNHAIEANRSIFSGKLTKWIENIKREEAKEILPFFDKFDGRPFAYVISQINTNNYKKSFFWVETSGSHIPWRQCPEEFMIEQPICENNVDDIKDCSQVEANNAYKNSTLYTQYLLQKMMRSLKDKNAILFFSSDHGESTGENGYYGHGFLLPPNQRKIRDQINTAFMVWMSDSFKSKHLDEYNTLKNNSQKYMKHDVIFHSILDILSIESKIIDKNKSIFSNTFKDRTDINIQKSLKATSIKIKQENNQILFIVNHFNEEKYEIYFYLYKDDVKIDRQKYSKNFTYILNKKKFGSGKYRIKYFIIKDKLKTSNKKLEKETGYSKYITID